MVSKRTHIIQKLIAEPEYHGLTVQQAEQANDLISIKIRMELESQLERLFDELVPENLMLTVDKIVVELEDIDFADLESEYVKQIISKLKLELLKYLPDVPMSSSSANFLFAEVINSNVYRSNIGDAQQSLDSLRLAGTLPQDMINLEHQTVEIGAEAMAAYYRSLEAEVGRSDEGMGSNQEDLFSGDFEKSSIDTHTEGDVRDLARAEDEANAIAGQAPILIPKIAVGDLDIMIYYLQFGTYPQGVIPSDTFDFGKTIFNLIDFYPKQFYEKLWPIVENPLVGERLQAIDRAVLDKIKDVHLVEQLSKQGTWSSGGAVESASGGAPQVPLLLQEPLRDVDKGTLSLALANKMGSVLYFMNYGVLPWWNQYEDLRQLILEVYLHDSEVDFFKFPSNLKTHLQSFLNATDGPVIRTLVERSLKSHGQLIILHQDLLVRWMQRRKVSRQQFEVYPKQAWFFLLNYLLDRGFDRLDREDLVLTTVDYLQATFAVGKSDILADFRQMETEIADTLLQDWLRSLTQIFTPTLDQKQTYLHTESVLFRKLKEILAKRDLHFTLFEARARDFFGDFLTLMRDDSSEPRSFEQLLAKIDQMALQAEQELENLSLSKLQSALRPAQSAAPIEKLSFREMLEADAVELPTLSQESVDLIADAAPIDLTLLLELLQKALKNKEVFAELLKLQKGKISEISDHKFRQLRQLIKAELLAKNPEISKELLKFKLDSIEKQSIEFLVPIILKFYEEEQLLQLADEADKETQVLEDYIYQLKLFVKMKLTANAIPWWNAAFAERDLDSVLVDLMRVIPQEAFTYVRSLYGATPNKELVLQVLLENSSPNIRYQFFSQSINPQLATFALIFKFDALLAVDTWDIVLDLLLSELPVEETALLTHWLSKSLDLNKFTIDQMERTLASAATFEPIRKTWELMKDVKTAEMLASTEAEKFEAVLPEDTGSLDDTFVDINGQKIPATEVVSLFVFFLQRGHLPLDTVMMTLDEFELAVKKVSLLLPGKFVSSLQKIERNHFTQHLVVRYLSDSFYTYLLQYFLHGNAEIIEKWTEIFLVNSTLDPAIVKTHAIDFVRQAKPADLELTTYTKDLVRFILRATQSKAYLLVPALIADFEKVASDQHVQLIMTDLKQIQSQLTNVPRLIQEDTSVPATEPKELVVTKPIFVRNAGLVLLWPFFVHYFKFNDLLDKDNKFKTIDDAKRAVHLLQYLACKQTNSPEIDLTLNKILCGLPINTPIPKSIEMNEKEIEVAESLLQACITQWPAIKNTTPDGLRGSFLIRDGYLSTDASQNWVIKVEGKAWDILLERLNWGLSMIKLSWVKGFIYIEWKKSAL